MKNLITYLKTLWGQYNLQSNDVICDRRLTVGRPSGLNAKWKQNPFMRFAVFLTLIILCSIGSGNVWADSQSFNKDDFPLSTSSTKTPITVTFSAKSISGQQIRFNSGATVTFTSSSGKITGIAVSTNSTNQYIKDMGATVSTGTWSGSGTSYSWSGNASSITMTAGAACRITTMTVTYSAASCTQNPTVSAGDNSSVTATTATVSCSGISSLGSAGCSISSYGFVIGGSANPAIGGPGVTQHEVGTTYTSTGVSFDKNLTGLSAETTYYVRPYATNGKGTAYGAQTSFTTPALPKYTVNWYVNGSVAHSQTGYEGATLTSIPEPTSSDCDGSKVFVGWYTSTYSHASTAPAYVSPTTIPNGGANYYAVFATASGGDPVNEWRQCTSLSDFVDGDFYLFVSPSYNSTYYYVPAVSSTTAANNFSKAGEAVASNSIPTSVTKAQGAWKLIKSGNAWKIQSSNSSTTYLYATNTNNGLAANTATNASSTWSIAKHSTTSTFAFQYNSSRYLCAYNVSPYGFRTYTGTNTNGTAYLTVYHWDSYTPTTYSNYETNCCTDPGLAYGTASVTKTFGNGTFKNTLTNSHSVSVTYESSNTDVATVASDGTVTIQGAGNATITARFAGNSTYCADEASYTLTVNKASISPTLTYTPSSVAAGSSTSAPTVGGNPGSGGVTYAITSATPSGCATINTSTGVVTGVAVGSVTVTATIGATANYNGNTATATVNITAASNFINGETVFIQAESSSAWNDNACVKAWFNNSGADGAAQTTYWLFDATGDDAGKKVYATIVPSTGTLNQVQLQRFASNCSTWWNSNGDLTKAASSGSNAFRSYGGAENNVAWNPGSVTLDLMGDPNSWASTLGTLTDQGNGVWSTTYNNYAPANAAGESQGFKLACNYNGWVATNNGENETLSGMHVGSTYNITATLDIKDHILTMSKTYVKGTVHFNMNGHGSAIADLTNVTAGSKISAPSAPTETGWTFGGWYKEAGCTNAWNFGSDVVNETMTLYAKWTKHNYTITSTLTNCSASPAIPSSYEYTGSAASLSYTITPSSGYSLPTTITVTGTTYTWDSGTGTLVLTGTITSNVTITITAIQAYTVTFVHHDKGVFSGGSTEVLVPSNANTITLPTVTDVSCGFYDTFEGWIASGSEYSESTSKPATVYAGGSSYTVSSDVTLRALYSKCEGAGGQSYHKVTAIGDVTDGTYILVSNASTPTVYSGHSGSNTYGDCITGLTADGDDYSSTLPSGAVQVTATRGTGDNVNYFSLYNGSKYIVAGTSTGTSNDPSWWKLTDGSNVNSKSCPANVLQPSSQSTYVLQKNNSYNRFKTYTNTQTAYVFLYKLIDKCTKSYATNPSCVKPVGVHIVYNANGGEMTCSNQNKTYKVVEEVNQYPQLASVQDFCTSATRSGYTLVGWNTQANGLGTTYNINQHYYSLPVSGDLDGENWVTLNVYAMWASAVSFNLGNATGGTGVPAVVEEDGGFMLPTPTAAQLGTIPCGYSFYGWSENSVSSTQTKPALFMPGTKYTGSARTLYAVYRLAGEGGNPDLFSLSYMVSSTKYYVAAPSGITTAPSTWNNDKAAKFTASTNAEDAVAFGMKTNSEYTSFKEIYWVYDGDEDEKAYLSWSSGANITFKNEEDTYYHKWTVTGTTTLTFQHSGGRYLSGTTTEIGCPSDVGVSTFTKEEASTTTYTYATNPSCETTATLAFVTNGGTLNYPDTYDASNYVDLTVGTSVYLPTATFAGEWVFEGWMKGAPVTETDIKPESANFYTVTLNTTTYNAAPAGTTTFYAVYSKTVNDKQFDPVNGGTYKLFAIMSDGTTKKYMPVWDGTQTTLTPVTSCASTGDYTITPGTGVHAGLYQITHGSYTLGVKGDGDTQFKDDADAWWNIEASTSGKGTYRITIVGSSTRCMAHSGTGFFSNTIIRNFVDNPSQPNYRDMEIGECIYTEYTSTPENIPYITITGSPVKITSTNGERVYAPTKIHIEAHNFSTTRTIHFSATNGFATNPASVNTADNGSYSGDIDIYYQPTTDGDGSIVSSVLTASQIAGPAAEHVEQTFSAIRGRNLPANFVIAVKSGTQWYAMPDDKTTSDVVKAVPIEVNDPDAPTAASLVPHNVEWRLSDVVNSGDRPKDKVYFYEPNKMKDDGITPWNYALYAGSYPTIGTYGQLSGISGSNSHTYEWGLTTSDLCAYTISNANVGKNISINTQGNFGTHASNVVSETLYLLPITAYYVPAEFQVVEWKANSVVVMYLGNAAKASVQVGDNDEGSNQTLEDVKVDHGVYELAASGLTSATFAQLQIVFKNAGGTELQRNYVTIPAIINGNVATSTFESVKDLAESNDVVILKGGKLTSTGTKTPATSYSFANITIYGGGKLDVAAGTKLGVTGSLILRAGGIVDGAYDYVYPQLNLASTATLTNSSGYFYYEYITDYNRWYHLVLPFDARTTSIKYPTEYYGSAVAADNHGSWVIKRYDGATRATGNYNAWVDIESAGEPTPTTVNAGKGYIFWGAPKKVTANGVKDRQAWGIQRISMQKAAATAISEENGDKTITGLGSYSGVSGNSGKNNDQGWNLLGNPYMVNLTGLNSSSLQVGQLVHTSTVPWDGKWEWDNTDPDAGGLRYVTIPDNHFDTYEAQTMAWFTELNPMKTGRTFFVQIAGANTSVLFAASNRASLMPALYAKTEQSVDVETGIVMSDETKKDEVNFWIKDGKTAEYEYNADYPKTMNQTNFNIYGVHSHGDLSWIAISPEIAEGSMAIGYQVPAAGEYTLSLSNTYVSDKIEHLYVTDHAMSPEVTVDLQEAPYAFTVLQAETNNERFTVSIKLKDESPGTTTDINQVDLQSEQPLKFIYQNKMYILRGGVIYDATGKRIKTINK